MVPHRGGPVRGRTCDVTRLDRCARATLLASVLFFFAIGARSLHEPGLLYDEAFDAVVALDVLTGHAPRCADTVRLFGADLPLMVHPHIGPTSVYTSLAGMVLLGPSVESLRLSQLCVGALALPLLFLLGLWWFGAPVAAIAVLLCGSAPGFIWWSRAGANWTVPLLPAALGSLLALTCWWRRRQPLTLALGAFAFGLGITTKILFTWLVLPLALTALLATGPRAVLAALRRTPWPALLLAAAALTVGLGPLIASNVAQPQLFEHIKRNAVSNPWGHDNRAFLPNVAVAVTAYLGLMDGEVLMSTPRVGWRIGAIALALAVVYGIATLLRRRVRWTWSDRAAEPAGDALAARTFLLAVPLTVLPQSAFTTSVVSSTYTFLIVPLVWLLIAVMLGDLVAPARPAASALASRTMRAVGLVLLVVLLASNVATNVDLLEFFARTGGRGQWSDAIYRTTEILEQQHPAQPVVALDWGFARNIEFLTTLRRPVVEGHEFRPVPTASYAQEVAQLLRPGTIVLAHVDGVAICAGCLAIAKDAAAGRGLELALRHVVDDREGQANTEIYEVALADR